ncbi:MAG: hypothetical protein PUP90_21985 [Nostoc sp. S4]|nr:hypothetical protein [Nostoc sp. S4]
MAIFYLPSEELDAAEVIKLIEQAGRKAAALPGDITDENFAESHQQQQQSFPKTNVYLTHLH